MNVPPFLAEYRSSGILLHVTSLPSPYGIGDVGPAALAWIDRLHQRRQVVGVSLASISRSHAGLRADQSLDVIISKSAALDKAS